MSDLYRILRCGMLCSILVSGGLLAMKKRPYISEIGRIKLKAVDAGPGEVLDISPVAARLSGTIQAFLEEAEERITEGKEIEEINEIPLYSVDKATLKNIILMLEDITTGLNTRKIDGLYVAYKAQPFVNKGLSGKSFNEIKVVFDAANFLYIPLLMNAVAREMVLNNQALAQQIVADKEEKIAKQTEKYGLLGPIIYLKKHLKLFNAGISKEYSIADFIEEHPGWVEDYMKSLGFSVSLNLGNQKLTSLSGIKLIDSKSRGQMEELYLDGNFLLDHEHDPDFPARPFQGLNNLKKLSMRGNQFTNLPANIFQGLNSLENLSMGRNKFINLPANIFQGLNNLRELFMHGNQLTNLPANIFQGLNNLIILSIDENQFTNLPANIFHGLNDLRILHLGKNQFTNLPVNIFQGLNNLRYLFMAESQFTNLPVNIFQGLNNLEKLDLSNNQFTNLPANIFQGLNNLETLTMDGNQFTNFPANIFEGLNNLQELRLKGNPLTDQSRTNIRAFFSPKGVNFIF